MMVIICLKKNSRLLIPEALWSMLYFGSEMWNIPNLSAACIQILNGISPKI